MLAHGFTVEQLAELVRAGLATVLYAFNSPARRLMRAARVAAADGAEVVRSGEENADSATRCANGAAIVLRRNPTTGVAGCCALAVGGHAAAAPPMSVMNSRRLMSNIGTSSVPSVLRPP
jgi:hypothetical protein